MAVLMKGNTGEFDLWGGGWMDVDFAVLTD